MQWKRLGIEQTFPVLGAYQFLDAVYWLWHIKTSCKHQARGSLGSYKEIKVKFCTHTRLTLSDCTQSCIYIASKDPAHTHTYLTLSVASKAVESFPPFFLCWGSGCLLSVYFKPLKMCCLISSPYPEHPNENPEVLKLFFLQPSLAGLGSAEKNGRTFLVPVELGTALYSWFLTTGFQSKYLEWDLWWDP